MCSVENTFILLSAEHFNKPSFTSFFSWYFGFISIPLSIRLIPAPLALEWVVLWLRWAGRKYCSRQKEKVSHVIWTSRTTYGRLFTKGNEPQVFWYQHISSNFRALEELVICPEEGRTTPSGLFCCFRMKKSLNSMISYHLFQKFSLIFSARWLTMKFHCLW